MQITLNLRRFKNQRCLKNSFGFCIMDCPDVQEESREMPYSILRGY